MNEHLSETTARHQIAERVADASQRRLASYLPSTRRHRLGLGLRSRNDRPDN